MRCEYLISRLDTLPAESRLGLMKDLAMHAAEDYSYARRCPNYDSEVQAQQTRDDYVQVGAEFLVRHNVSQVRPTLVAMRDDFVAQYRTCGNREWASVVTDIAKNIAQRIEQAQDLVL